MRAAWRPNVDQSESNCRQQYNSERLPGFLNLVWTNLHLAHAAASTLTLSMYQRLSHGLQQFMT
jgi:hypothetical protein